MFPKQEYTGPQYLLLCITCTVSLRSITAYIVEGNLTDQECSHWTKFLRNQSEATEVLGLMPQDTRCTYQPFEDSMAAATQMKTAVVNNGVLPRGLPGVHHGYHTRPEVQGPCT